MKQAKNSQHLMGPKGPLQCSQGSVTGLYPEPDEPSPHTHPISLRSILILYSNLRLGLPNGLFPSDFPTKTLYALLFYACYMPRPSPPTWLVHSNYIWRRVQFTTLIVQFYPVSLYFIPPTSSAPWCQTFSVDVLPLT
jgi:hypothetical protein